MYFQLCVESSIEKTLCCWMCTSGPISMTARSDRRGYCPGKNDQDGQFYIVFFLAHLTV